jgi:predicted dienelactone hydrolase
MSRRPSKRRPARWLLAFPLILLLLGSGARLREGATMTAVAARPDAVGYAAPGPHAVGTARARIAGDAPLDVAFWYPAAVAEEAPAIAYPYALKWFVRLDGVARVAGHAHRDAPVDAAAGPRPLVVLSPGFAMGTTAYAWLAERLAAHGFVVAAPEHREAMGPSMADFGRALVDRPDDVRALLDHLASGGGPLAGAVDLERVAVVGHSLGGFTALAAAGARLDLAAFEARCGVDRAGAAEHAWLCDLVLPHAADVAARAGLAAVPRGPWPGRGDARVDAAVSFAGDAFLFDRAGLAEVAVPLLVMGGTADAAAPFDWTTALAFEHAGAPRRAQVALNEAEHMVFAAGCEAVPFFALLGEGTFCGDPVWASERAQDVIAHLTVAFLHAELMDDATAAAALAPGAVAFEDVAYAAVGY